ncbi:MAG: hypothetical protein ACP5FL_06695, partial [Thermoplasmatota archaeon]
VLIGKHAARVAFGFMGTSPFFSRGQGSISSAVRRNVLNSRDLYHSMRYLPVVLILLLLCFSSLTLADDGSRA